MLDQDVEINTNFKDKISNLKDISIVIDSVNIKTKQKGDRDIYFKMKSNSF